VCFVSKCSIGSNECHRITFSLGMSHTILKGGSEVTSWGDTGGRGRCQGLTYNRMNRCVPPWPKAITRMGRKGSGDTFRLSRRNLRKLKPYEIYTQPDGLVCNAASTCEESPLFWPSMDEFLPSIRPSQDLGLNFRDGQEFVVHYVLV